MGPAHACQGSLDRCGDDGLGPADGAENLTAAVTGLDVADANLQVAFAVFAAADKGCIQAQRDGGGSRRLFGRRMAKLLADQQRMATQCLGTLPGVGRQPGVPSGDPVMPAPAAL